MNVQNLFSSPVHHGLDLDLVGPVAGRVKPADDVSHLPTQPLRLQAHVPILDLKQIVYTYLVL